MIKCGIYPLSPRRRGGVSVGQTSLPALVAGTEAHPTYRPGERVWVRGNLIAFSCQMGRSQGFIFRGPGWQPLMARVGRTT
jgi:hypothetical protein